MYVPEAARLRAKQPGEPTGAWRRRVRRLLTVGASLGAAAALVAACGSSSSSSAPAKAATGSTTTKRVTVYLSNNYMGNQWRPQMENDAKVIASQLGGSVKLVIQNSDGTPAAQIASLQSIIRNKPAAIMIDSASATALNPTLQAACSAGIVVFSFDQTVTAPCAYKLQENYEAEAHDMAQWIGTELHGKGNILMDTGLAGIPISETFVSVWKSELAKDFPGIHIVGTFSSEYAPGPELQGVSALLSQQKTINGILSGGYCSSDIQALKAAGRKLVPDTCLDVNGNEQVCTTDHVPCFFFAAPAYVSGVALEDIVKLVDKKQTFPKAQGYYNANFVSAAATTSFNHTQQVVPLTAGVNFYPTGSASLITPVMGNGLEITAGEALKGP